MKKVKSVRVPQELEKMNLSRLVKECENHVRDLESARLLKQQGDGRAAEALLKARQADLGKQVSKLVWEAVVQQAKEG